MSEDRKTFQFFFDEKCTVWCRTRFEVEAKDLDDAKTAAISFVESGQVTELSWEALIDTCELMSVDDNDGATQELYSNSKEDYAPIYDNYLGVRDENKNK